MTLDLDAIEARTNAANTEVDSLCAGRKRWTMRIPANQETDSDLVISASLGDVPALTAAIRAVLELHKPKHAIFSWKTGLRYEDPCTTCHGKAGIHECGCWAENDTEHVCEPCDQPGGTERATWPCATVQAITSHQLTNPYSKGYGIDTQPAPTEGETT